MSMSFINKFYIKPVSDKEKFVTQILEVVCNKGNLYREVLGKLKELSHFESEETKLINKICSLDEAIKWLLKGNFELLTLSFNSGRQFNIDFSLWKREEIKEVTIFLSDYSFVEAWHRETENGKIFIDKEGQKNFSLAILDLCKTLYNFACPFYGFGHNMDYIEVKTEYEDAEADNIKAIYWVNFFGPQLVEKFGKEKLLSAPCYITEELEDGGVMLVRSPNPFTIDEPYISAEEIERHLGLKREVFSK